MIDKLTTKDIFLIDGIGAFISAFALGVILPKLQNWIGMPTVVLNVLALWALGYAAYSIFCYRFLISERGKWLRTLIFLNLLYCLITSILVIYFSGKLEFWGFLYFIGEIGIIVGLVLVERKIFLKSSPVVKST